VPVSRATASFPQLPAALADKGTHGYDWANCLGQSATFNAAPAAPALVFP